MKKSIRICRYLFAALLVIALCLIPGAALAAEESGDAGCPATYSLAATDLDSCYRPLFSALQQTRAALAGERQDGSCAEDLFYLVWSRYGQLLRPGCGLDLPQPQPAAPQETPAQPVLPPEETQPAPSVTDDPGANVQPAPELPTPAPEPAPEPQPEPRPEPEAPAPSAAEQDGFAQEVVRLVNAERAAAGLAPLTESLTLDQAAYVRAGEIITSFSHTRPDGSSCFTALQQAGAAYSRAGENIAIGQRSPAQVVQAWMDSPGHRANIMNPDFTQIGVAARPSSGYYSGYAWAQFFTD